MITPRQALPAFLLTMALAVFTATCWMLDEPAPRPPTWDAAKFLYYPDPRVVPLPAVRACEPAAYRSDRATFVHVLDPHVIYLANPHTNYLGYK